MMLGSRSTPGVPSRYEWVQDAYEQMVLCKYDGRPHWGKNWPRTFLHPNCSIPAKYGAGFDRLTELQSQYDPDKVFEPELWGKMARGEQYELKPRCILDRSCYCEVDVHCTEGFVCVPSAALPEFKVCKPRFSN